MTTSTPARLGPPLLTPLALGGLRLPNRVVMAPTTRARADNPGLLPTERHAAYYGQRAAAGLIVAEATWVSREAIGFVNVPGVFTGEQVAAWRQVTGTVHALGGRIVLQLWHTGAASHPEHLGGRRPAGPSAVDPRVRSFTPSGFRATVTPREMTPDDIAAAVADFRAASLNARRAGFDGVEVAAHGSFLIAQFLSPRLNRRTDAYGGDRARRRRLLLEIVDAVAGPWQGGGCVGVRLAPYLAPSDRFAADDALLADLDALVTELNRHPVDYLHLRGRDRTGQDAGPDLDAFGRFRRRFAGPLVANNGFDGASANAAIEQGGADAVSFATHFIANPDLVLRLALGRPLAAADPATYYTGGIRGYLDRPAAAWH